MNDDEINDTPPFNAGRVDADWVDVEAESNAILDAIEAVLDNATYTDYQGTEIGRTGDAYRRRSNCRQHSATRQFSAGGVAPRSCS